MKPPFVSSSFHERELMTCCLDYDRQLGNIPVQKMDFFAGTAAGVEFFPGETWFPTQGEHLWMVNSQRHRHLKRLSLQRCSE